MRDIESCPITFEEAGAREPHGLWEYGVAFALDGLGRDSEAMSALARAIARTELHEQVTGALRDLALLERSHPNPQQVDGLRRRLLQVTGSAVTS